MVAELFNTTLFDDANLVSYWRLEGNSNDSKSTNNGTDTNITYSAANGKFNQGAGCNGSSSKIVIADAAALKPTGKFSVIAWVKTSNTNDQQIFQSYSQNTNFAGFRIAILATSGYIRFISGANTGTVADTDYKQLDGDVAVNDGNWHMVVCVYDQTKLYIYVDNNAVDNVAWTTNAGYAATNYVRIGCRNTAGTDNLFLNGATDDIALFSRDLSATEVSNFYSGALTKATGATGSLFFAQL
jgi:hypothetical protein